MTLFIYLGLSMSFVLASEVSINLFAAHSAAYRLERIRRCILVVSFWQLTMFLIIDSG
jgi:hypothetical protein